MNDEGARLSATAVTTNLSPLTVSAARDAQALDVRERLVRVLDELEAGDAGVDVARTIALGLLEDLDCLAAAVAEEPPR